MSRPSLAHADEPDGRLTGLLELPDGRRVSCLFWNHFFKEFSGVQQLQVVLCKNGSFQFLLVGKWFSSPREGELPGILRGFLKTIPL